MNYDNYIISNGKEDITIYPLLEVEKNNKKYLIYSNTTDHNIILNNLFVGEVTDANTLLPVDNSLLADFEIVITDSWETIIQNINKNA